MLDVGSGISTVLASVVTGFFVLAAGVLTARATTRRAESERIWNARKYCYNSILSALKKALEAADVVDRGYNSGHEGLSPHGYFSSPLREPQENKAVEAWTTCEAEFTENQLIVSDDFLTRFMSLLDSLPTEHDSLDPPEDARRRAACLHQAYRDLFPLARSEIFPPGVVTASWTGPRSA